jgi:hypothetical protein
MVRVLFPVGLLILALVPPGRGGPVDGTSWSTQRVPGGDPGTLQFSKAFVAGQRACVIVIGDHKPVVDVEIKVYDAKGKVVAEDRGQDPARDFVAAIWYPPRQETYRIEVRSYGKDYNDCSIAVK